MSKESLDNTNIITGLEQVSSKRVAKSMGGDFFWYLCPTHGIIERFLHV